MGTKRMAGGGRMKTKGRSKGGVVRRMGGGRMKTKYRSLNDRDWETILFVTINRKPL